jgi:Family of unknown function (DUF6174)
MRRAVVGVVLALILVACEGDPVPPNARQSTQPSSRWSAPDNYEFELYSSCGERTLIGRFHIVVEDGRVIDARALDERARTLFRVGLRSEIPTLEELLEEVAEARRSNADLAKVTTDSSDGHPTLIEIDYNEQAIDDEACYEISAYSTTAAATIEIPTKYQVAKSEGDHGLRIMLSTPEAVVGGQVFNVIYEVADDEGEIRGIEVDWGDGKTWGGMPMDLVCTGVVGKRDPVEPAARENKKLRHAYRREGVYKVRVSAYTGGCHAHWDRTGVALEVEVIGEGEELNGPMPPKAKIGHAYYTNGDPSILVSDIGGYDEDGFVQRIEIDWGDGSTQILEQDWERCDAVQANYPGGWFSQPTEHEYEDPGDYLVRIEVTSVGCDGKTEQTDSAQRTLRSPPKQGS